MKNISPFTPARLKALAVVALIVVLLLLGRRAASLLPALAEQVSRLGAWGPVIYVAVYIVGAVLLIPGSVLTLAAGVLFGLVRGTALVFLAATLGAVAAFLVARYLARGYVERRIGTGRLAAVDRALARKGLRLVLLLRLTPVVPYSLLNYSLGLTAVSFRDFLLGSAGMLPGTLLYVYYGKVAGDVAALAGGRAVPHDTTYWVSIAVGLAATVAASVMVARTARRALREEESRPAERPGPTA
ncbi:MAG: TVP38/TMEM64 family protein [Gemmatimonadales bacterium]|nr:TVP38/TMEM64 family protein [Gemmatimonadales bacterium]